jgi:hypothetical protein
MKLIKRTNQASAKDDLLDDHSIFVNFIGIGCLAVGGRLDDSVWNKIQDCALKLKRPINSVFFDCEFIPLLDERRRYDSWHDFNDLFELKGLLLSDKSLIEIRTRRKRLVKVPPSEVFESKTLFPLFNKTIAFVDSNIKGRISTLCEYSIGKVASFQFETKKFDLQKLSFSFTELTLREERKLILTNLYYEGKLLSSIGEDTVVTNLLATIINNK